MTALRLCTSTFHHCCDQGMQMSISLTADSDKQQRHAVESQQVIAGAACLAAARWIAAGNRREGATGPAKARLVKDASH